jgi:uncharacterized protein (TIGR01777 family)
MKVVVAGGSGFIGRPLCQALLQDEHQVTVLSRSPAATKNRLDSRITIIEWDGCTPGGWEQTLDTADAIINLTGEAIADKRWSEDRKQALRDSRIGTTRAIVQALSRVPIRSRTLINASAIGYYGPRDATPVTEESQPGSDFLAKLCIDWEQEAAQAESLGIRVVRLRIGIVLGKKGGALPRMLPPFYFFLGGPIAPGHQWMSWIHERDVVGLILWTLANQQIRGPLNAVAPQPVTMREFCRTLGHILKRPSWLPVPEAVLRLMLGELATLLTTGQRVEPTGALRGGYVFKYSALGSALREIMGKPSSGRSL